MTCRCCDEEDRLTAQVRGIELCDLCAGFHSEVRRQLHERQVKLLQELRELVDGLAGQQAMPDDSLRMVLR